MLYEGCDEITKLEDDLVGWNIELETDFCEIDPQEVDIINMTLIS